MLHINLITAFLAGLVTFFAPCTFVTLPYFIAYITTEAFGLAKEGEEKYRYKILISALIYILGFLLVFTLLGMTATIFGEFLNQWRQVFLKLGGVLMIFFGFFIIFGHKYKQLNFLQRTKRIIISPKIFITNNYFSPFFIGVTSALSWTPCIGPILGSILFLASYTTTKAIEGGFLLFVYGLGMMLPFLFLSLFLSYLEKPLKKLNKYTGLIFTVCGIILVLLGISLITGFSDVIFSQIYKVFISLGYNPQ